jgi:hypothetical protein
MRKKADVSFAYKNYFKKIGVPNAIIRDFAKEEMEGEAKKVCNKVGCDLRVLEKGTNGLIELSVMSRSLKMQ